MNNVVPKLKLLNEEQIQQVHQYALHILLRNRRTRGLTASGGDVGENEAS